MRLTRLISEVKARVGTATRAVLGPKARGIGRSTSHP